jgi:hypothetical protein
MEEEERKEMGYELAKEIEEGCLLLRWMDDLVIVVVKQLSIGAKRWVKGRVRIGAYGNELKLMETEGTEAFGFQWREVEGRLEVWADEKWTNKHEKVVDFVPQSGLFAGMGFVKQGVKEGVLKGMFMRVLDCTNVGEEEVILKMMRLVAGFRLVGHREKMVRRVVQAVQRDALLRLNRLDEVWGWSQEELKAYCAGYDAVAKSDELGARLTNQLNAK